MQDNEATLIRVSFGSTFFEDEDEPGYENYEMINGDYMKRLTNDTLYIVGSGLRMLMGYDMKNWKADAPFKNNIQKRKGPYYLLGTNATNTDGFNFEVMRTCVIQNRLTSDGVDLVSKW